MNTVSAEISVPEDPRTEINDRRWLRLFSKLVCLSVFFLIFKGALVTSNDAGLAVPDWPTSFGENMFLFPPSKWKGIIFYEHVHRLLASAVGMLTVILAVWLLAAEKRSWVKKLACASVVLVICQGVLGGLTVIYLLPAAISSLHGVLGQTFFIAMLFLAYSQSLEMKKRIAGRSEGNRTAFRHALVLTGLVYLQLMVGAVMRHTESGLAIPDFPKMGGTFLPAFDAAMLETVNAMRAVNRLIPVEIWQVAIHFAHRLVAALIVAFGFVMLYRAGREVPAGEEKTDYTPAAILAVIVFQFLLGVITVISVRNPLITSLHVVSGALLLGLAVLYLIRNYDYSAKENG